LIQPGAGEHFHEATWLPGGAVVVLVDPDEAPERLDLWDGTSRHILSGAIGGAAYAAPGFILYEGQGGIWATRYSKRDRALVGDPFLAVPSGVGVSASNDGSLVVGRRGSTRRDIVWVDRSGVVREPVVSGEGVVVTPRLSPDASRVAYAAGGRIHTRNPSLGTRATLDPDMGRQLRPVWSRNGQRVIYATIDPGLDEEEAYLREHDPASGATRTIVERGWMHSVSRDGRYIAYLVGPPTGSDLFYLKLDRPDASAQPFVEGAGQTYGPSFSPANDIIAYVHSDEGFMSLEVFVSRFPGGGERTQVSRGPVEYTTPLRWSGDGSKLYYPSGVDGALMEVEVGAGQAISVSEPRRLFGVGESKLELGGGFDVNEDGTRFLVVRSLPREGPELSGVILIQNWLAGVDTGGQ